MGLYSTLNSGGNITFGGTKEEIIKHYPKLCLSNGKCIDTAKIIDLINLEGK